MLEIILLTGLYINSFGYPSSSTTTGYEDDYEDYCPAINLDWWSDSPNNLVGINFTIVAGYKYEIQCSPDYVNWITVSSFIADWEETPLTETTYSTGFLTNGVNQQAYFRVFAVCKEHRGQGYTDFDYARY